MNHLLSPPVRLIELDTGRGKIHVVDDSVLPGGTKQRAAIPFLQDLQRSGYQSFCYASPPTGYAQIALARSCEAVGARCIIFAQSMEDGDMSPFTRAIAKLAYVELCSSLEEAESAAAKSTAFQIPLGFDHDAYNQHLRRAIKRQWSAILHRIQPKRLWVPIGSGTLYRAFRSVVDCEIVAVDVRVLPATDKRVAGISSYRAPELFRDPCEVVPPIASNAWYDAKLWRFLLEHGRDGDVWWNVAK